MGKDPSGNRWCHAAQRVGDYPPGVTLVTSHPARAAQAGHQAGNGQPAFGIYGRNPRDSILPGAGLGPGP
jgi:hypothetical protein